MINSKLISKSRNDSNILKAYFNNIYQGVCNEGEENHSIGMNMETFEILFNFPLLFSQKLFRLIDKEKKGFISNRQFIEAMYKLFNGPMTERIRMLFDLLDFNEDGIVNTEDILLITYHISLRANFNKLSKLKQMILNHINGRINYEEFTNTISLNSDLIWYLCLMLDKLCPLTPDVYNFLSKLHGPSNAVAVKEIDCQLTEPSVLLMDLLKNYDNEDDFSCLNLLDDFDQDIQNAKLKVNSSPILKIFENIHLHAPDSRKVEKIEKDENELIVEKFNDDILIETKLLFKFNQIFEFVKLDDRSYMLKKIFLNWNKIYLEKKPTLYQNCKYYTLVLKLNNDASCSYVSLNEEEVIKFIEKIGKHSRNQKINLKYTIEKYLAKGGYSTVYLGYNNVSKEKVAIKAIMKENVRSEMLKWEKEVFKILRKVPHKGIAEAIDLYENDKVVFLVYKFYQNLSWRNLNLSDLQILEISLQILEALQHLNELGIIHRDIKLDNVLLTKTKPNTLEIKLIDFGFARVISKEEKLTDRYGTAMYCSPEILLGHEYSFKIDIWSLGVVIYYLKYKAFPFTDEDADMINTLVINGIYSLPESKNPRLRNLISRCLVHSPERRIQASNLIYQS